jgi:hypothetical protein
MVVVEGTVVAVEPAPDRTRFRIRYRYRVASGAPQHGFSGWIGGDEAAGWQAEDRGAVGYDPDRPEVSEWIGEMVVDQARSWAASDRSAGEG